MSSNILVIPQWVLQKMLLLLIVVTIVPQQKVLERREGRISLFYAEATLTCTFNADSADNSDAYGANICSQKVHPDSVCMEDGYCSNPYSKGCLYGHHRRKAKKHYGIAYQQQELEIIDPDNPPPTKRVCNSNDPPTAAADGLCFKSRFNYTEIRIHNADWESSILLSWIMQIVLSERLEVPVTIGLGGDKDENGFDKALAAGSFYNNHNSFAYSSTSYPFDAIDESNHMPNGDCRLSDNQCCHVMPEVWNGQQKEWTRAVEDNIIDAVEGSGMVGKVSIYTPAFSVVRDPTLSSFYGLAGEQNRQKLASTFKRPTTWIDYCNLVSTTNCSVADDIALRYPEKDGEQGLYHHSQYYQGHFRATEQNDCEMNPTTCSGHIVAPPCTWSSFLDSQLFWNNIAMESNGPLEPNGGYSYGSMIQIWQAANATKSDTCFWWWKPDKLVEQFRGHEGEFQQVLFPDPTAVCSRARPSSEDRCSADETARRGSIKGSCDSEAHSLRKILAASLRQMNVGKPPADRSPAYDLVRNLRISDLEMTGILQDWATSDIDSFGFGAREAVCSWVVENIDALDAIIPIGYPRVLSDKGVYKDKWYIIAARAFACLGCVTVIVAAILVFKQRNKRVFVCAQVYFVFLLLFGFFLVCLGSIIYDLEPSLLICVSREWLVTLGFTFELGPLLVKISAIVKVMHSAKRLRRVAISAKSLFISVTSLIVIVMVYLIIWTILDPPNRVEQRIVPHEEDGNNVVESSLFCASQAHHWVLVSFAFHGILLVCATVLAYQSRNITQNFNESRSLATMVYSHFVFTALRLLTLFLESSHVLPPVLTSSAVSVILTIDIMAALFIYLAPKLLHKHNKRRPALLTSSYIAQNLTKFSWVKRSEKEQKSSRHHIEADSCIADDCEDNSGIDDDDDDDDDMFSSDDFAGETESCTPGGASIDLPPENMNTIMEEKVREVPLTEAEVMRLSFAAEPLKGGEAACELPSEEITQDA